MKHAPIPDNEQERLLSLHKLGLLDTHPEERFDIITRTATQIFHVPISTLTLVDEKREWFKSCQGLSSKEGSRAISFCGHALLAPEMLVIPDTKKDVRFSDNPMVVGKPYIRFYAGVPISNADGQRVGVFCIKDTKPREFAKANQEILLGLAAWAELEVNSHNLSLALSERKRSEQDLIKEKANLQKANKKLESLDKLKDEFLSIASHELRTPLTAIDGLVSMILSGEYGEVNANLKQPLQDVNTSSQRLINLVNDLLSLSRIQAGKMSYNLSEFSIADVVNQAVHLLQPLSGQKGLRLEIAKLEPIIVQGDSEKVKEVLNNLIGNSLKFTDQGSITISTKSEQDKVSVYITDTGIGITKEDQGKLFGMFEQLESAKDKPASTGLGLHISQEMIRKMRGELWIDKSEVGVGSTFAFSLPIAKSQLAQKVKRQLI
ncbi:MAG: hypothetical protein A3B47_02360 [Candidatus Levybacteria bacterium RIFCSPLOWO2_01_FULL_39_24]|nr:MAG: hypothetical protein A2800_01655 [Candidatus Levybacteria bacterium RIFCSPHIGHO2_01_FULL_40_16]OGH28363.1 MAG: hypothetical protein A3E12_01775 [Candidatus Levybacteria bacterium RIFCSPHIGHO2_12_FULL_39_9]OGH46478.1 MAG: hypothetical protein A3B47_02360 [Candidatus Levybacteria bacterium RIFCSPLOWO2_01_FULL_39_24]